MKTIIGILLVSFLGFLGCDGSDDGTVTVGEANPVAPFGTIDILDPIYEWTPVPWATKYRLLVQDANETVVIEEWYTAEESGCASEGVLCTVHPGVVTVDENTWKIQACANQECGLWSELLNYDVKPTLESTETRFTDYGYGTVKDNNTQLMWSKDADLCGMRDWYDSFRCCDDLSLAYLNDWRLPKVNELKSLTESGVYEPALPPGHPFTNVQSGYYWTSTTSDYQPFIYYWHVIIYYAYVGISERENHYSAWCVRDVW